MHSRLSAFHDVCRLERRKVFEPETSRFGFAVTELPRLDDLVRLADFAADDADGVFDADARDGSVHEHTNEVQRLCLFFLPLFEPPRTRHRQKPARRMGNHQIPVFIGQPHFHVALNMKLFVSLCRQEIAGKRLVTSGPEGVPDNTAKFTRD